MPGVIHARAMPGVRMLAGCAPGMGMLVGCARDVFAVFVMCGVFSHGRSPSM